MPTSNLRPHAQYQAEDLLLQNQLCFALYAASLTMTKVYRPLLAAMGLTYPQYIVLLVLWDQDGLTVSQIGDKLALDSGTLTPLLTRLQKLSLIRRRRGSNDQREVYVDLTPKGRALRVHAPEVHRQVACATGCSTDELQALTAAIHQLRASLRQTLQA